MQSDDKSGEFVATMAARKQPTNKQSGQHGHHKNKQAAGGKAGKLKFICFKHARYGEDAFNCADKKNCTWSGN